MKSKIYRERLARVFGEFSHRDKLVKRKSTILVDFTLKTGGTTSVKVIIENESLKEDVIFWKLDLSNVLFDRMFFNSMIYFFDCNLVNTSFRRFVDLREVSFSESDLRFAEFVNLDLCDSIFLESDLRGANFSKTNLFCSHFGSCNLSGVNFANANLDSSQLSMCDLSQAISDGVTIRSANLYDCGTWEEFIFSSADFTGSYEGNQNIVTRMSHTSDMRKRYDFIRKSKI